jgi:hypothetical protein
LRSAWYWCRSSRLPVDPGWSSVAEQPGDALAVQNGWLVGLLKMSMESANLNSKASGWAAAAAIALALKQML